LLGDDLAEGLRQLLEYAAALADSCVQQRDDASDLREQREAVVAGPVTESER
jgi:hypothetical protein